MRLLIAVINEKDRLDEILTGFLELGITGATILDSRGMGRALSRETEDDPPAFAGLQSLIGRTRPENVTLFSVLPDDELAARALSVIEEACGGLDSPGTGIAFTVPIDRALGVGPNPA